MDTILRSLVRLAKATELSVWLPRLIGAGLLAPCMLTSVDDPDRELMNDLREALRLSGLSDKEVAHCLQINKGLCSKKLSGERVLPFLALNLLPVDVKRWLAVRWVMRHGVPAEVTAAAQLRAIGLSAQPQLKEGVA